jgi:oxygen-independent coproporphyrinogen-3 oxidase
LEEIQRTIGRLFEISPDAEIAIEVDPRNAAPDRLSHLRALGFNRISLGVQDFNEQVQQHVRRVQPFEMVRDTVDACREAGFASINFDLIYGLPYQTVETIRETVEQTIALSPDRVAYYHYAQIPEKIATQRGMDYTKLPDSETKLEMFLAGVEMFESAGYEFVGLDHFAKPDELLAKASRDGTLQRNFQGMTTGGGLDLIGMGSSSISHLLGVGFTQNIRDVNAYVECIEDGDTPIRRGKRFTPDDLLRQGVLNQLYCAAEINPDAIEERFGIVFADYFAPELEVLKELERDGLVTGEPGGIIRATYPLGRVLMRNVAAVFDAYLAPDAYRVGEQTCFSANA